MIGIVVTDTLYTAPPEDVSGTKKNLLLLKSTCVIVPMSANVESGDTVPDESTVTVSVCIGLDVFRGIEVILIEMVLPAPGFTSTVFLISVDPEEPSCSKELISSSTA